MNTNTSGTAIEESIFHNKNEDNVNIILRKVRQRQYPFPCQLEYPEKVHKLGARVLI